MKVDPRHHHDVIDPHRPGSRLADVILGGQDGVVNVLGVILGVAAATSDARLVLVAGLAATFAESVSMAAVAFTSLRAEAAQFDSEREREYRHIQTVPEVEREEVRAMYRAKGFEGPLLDKIVEAITANPDVWVALMLAEEHGLKPISTREALASSLWVGAAALVGSLIPLLPFLVVSVPTGMALSVALAALALFVVGVAKARMTVGHPFKSGLELAVIGTVSAMIGFAVGWVLKVPVTP